MNSDSFIINDRPYNLPGRPIVVICIDGCADEYLDTSMAAGRMPNLSRMVADGYRGKVRGALPSFTNVNNSAIVTGTPPSVTGICGNFFLDPDTGEEVMMNSASFLRADTILGAAASAGRKVAMVTAKEKLRDLLARDLDGIAFSAEKANQAKLDTHGIEDVEALVGLKTPPIYGPDASLFVLRAGVALLDKGRADFLYLTLTDYMQHKYAPEAEESLAFHEAIDVELGKLLAHNAVIGITADHGMNAKNTADGEPNVIYLQSVLDQQYGNGTRVICPITDPYVVHHGALGSLVMVHLSDLDKVEEMKAFILSHDGITEVYDRESAAAKLELAPDRIGDLVVLSGRDVVVGRTPDDHDLSVLTGGLRSHGGRYEEMVPMVLSEPLNADYQRKAQGDPRNFDIFDFTCNGAVQK